MDPMRARWKGKTFADVSAANPMSKLVSQLQNSLIQGNAHAILTDCNVLLDAAPPSADLLDRACFGRRIVVFEKKKGEEEEEEEGDEGEDDKQWFQLSFEEAFYLHYSLRCLTIFAGKDEGGPQRPLDGTELWARMECKNEAFPELFAAYAHLRAKNWVVRPGTQYGVDFVVYRHHPALVHSEYAVLVLAEGNSYRLKVWSDVQCCVRVCGSVAKTLLALYVKINGGDGMHPTCLSDCQVEERTLRRWLPEQSREGGIVRQNLIEDSTIVNDDLQH